MPSTETATNLAILVVGNTRRAEFRQPRTALDRLGNVVWCGDVEQAVQRLTDGPFVPDLIVVAQSYPGEITAPAIDRLRALAPLARVVGLLGAWCEGEVRTGRPWPGVIRVYWHQWIDRCERELARLADGLGSTWALPATAGEEEHLLTLAACDRPPREGLIVVHAAQFDMADWLTDACKSRGYSTRWVRPGVSAGHASSSVPRAAIFNHQEGPGGDFETLARFCAELAPTPVVVLMDFPRPRDHAQALAAGAQAVVSKPLLIEDLFWRIDRLGVRPCPPAQRAALGDK